MYTYYDYEKPMESAVSGLTLEEVLEQILRANDCRYAFSRDREGAMQLIVRLVPALPLVVAITAPEAAPELRFVSSDADDSKARAEIARQVIDYGLGSSLAMLDEEFRRLAMNKGERSG